MPRSSSTTRTLGPEPDAAGSGAALGAVMAPRLGEDADRCRQRILKPQLSIVAASMNTWPVLVGALSRTTPIRVRPLRTASNSRHSPAAGIQPVLIPMAP